MDKTLVTTFSMYCEHNSRAMNKAGLKVSFTEIQNADRPDEVVVLEDKGTGARKVYFSTKVFNLLTGNAARFFKPSMKYGRQGYYCWNDATIKEEVQSHLDYPPHNKVMIVVGGRNQKIVSFLNAMEQASAKGMEM